MRGRSKRYRLMYVCHFVHSADRMLFASCVDSLRPRACGFPTFRRLPASNGIEDVHKKDGNTAVVSFDLVLQLVFWLSTRTPSPGQCASTTLPNISEDATDDYDIHIPLSEIPLGVNVGPSLEVLSFAKDPRTGELPWVARRGWLEVGDVLVSLVSHEGEYMSEVIYQIIPSKNRR